MYRYMRPASSRVNAARRLPRQLSERNRYASRPPGPVSGSEGASELGLASGSQTSAPCTPLGLPRGVGVDSSVRSDPHPGPIRVRGSAPLRLSRVHSRGVHERSGAATQTCIKTPGWQDEFELHCTCRWPRHLPGPSGLLSRDDRTPIELFLAGVRVWENSARRCVAAIGDGA